jgi:hypothetical protein
MFEKKPESSCDVLRLDTASIEPKLQRVTFACCLRVAISRYLQNAFADYI